MVAELMSGAAPSTTTLIPGVVIAARKDTSSVPCSTGSARSGTGPGSGSDIGLEARCRMRTSEGAGLTSASARTTCQTIGRPATGWR
jgi:hypothetical protein